MSRRRRQAKRQIVDDPIYGLKSVSKFINALMIGGKKTTAEKIFYNSFSLIKEKAKEDPVKIFNEAIKNVKPNLEVKSRRVGGATYQVPVEVKADRGQALAIRWLLDAAKKRGDKTMQERLMKEFLDASTNKGSAIKKREDTHKMAESNKAFAHFRW
ncbi:MAG: 30S ribosomal protein S7 [Pelagibacteraceae bacterium]|nr:30S ribosomal protein S7 [Pelagibacteraceae bacterium]MCI5079319.1 30S ribosomal protein S7 [Pelagibacteraceae bacterium]